MKNNLYIVGAGGFAREIYAYLLQASFNYMNAELVGFLDDNENALDDFNFHHKIITKSKTTDLRSNSVLIMAIANPRVKSEIFDFYKSKNISFLTYIHPTAFVGHDVIVGEGSVIGPNATLTTNINIGECVTINAHSSIGHDAKVGRFSTLSGHCDITGGVSVAENVFFGTHASVIPNKIIEQGAIVGAGSVVIRNVKQGASVFGNPAKKII
jgi:sugar O-acyltransferase (sialic acid O-acetyltransferase NeuD family)